LLAVLSVAIAVGMQAQPPTPSEKPVTANVEVMLGLLAVDLSFGAERGFYTGEDLLRDLRLGQRLRQPKPMGNLEVTRAFRAQGYVQGVFDALIDGVNAEDAHRQPKGKVQPRLCVSETLKNTDQMIHVIIEDLQRLPKESRKLPAHVVVAQALLAPDNAFIVPWSPGEGVRQP